MTYLTLMNDVEKEIEAGERYDMIEIIELVKQFDGRTAVDHLNLTIKQGEIFGLLGPNGAGKTTTIRMLTMLTMPTSGKIMVNGLDATAQSQDIRQLIGIVPQHINLDPDLTIGENLDLHGRLHHMDKKDRRSRIEKLLAYVELSDRKNDFVQTLSGGMKRRLMIARALLHRPRVLFLDEPTVGLDPQVRRRLWDFIRRLQSEDITVLVTTHYIEEAENLCSRVAIMEKGRLIALGSPDELRCRVGAYVAEWEEQLQRETRFFKHRDEAAAFVARLVETATIRKSNLEDVFVELTGRKVND